ncbi:MAG: metal transporter [Candidatus Schekmanbacteria bacterium RBG_13_48_7]|uniref:Metal transporter n=1 Tax=Candidatus Schekmanbacteria bacterium RBG_13_48_7 TaxID=1817878 RepID=A0A1F7RY88_9BACT|nr:MAG: metal transporter [Candidatus Schekmanbacteria bacterium RBG_13_48_7]
MSSFFKFILRQQLVIIFIIIAVVVIGIYAWKNLPIDAFPDVTNVQVMILTEAQGLAPVDVERQITFPIEIQMNGLPHIRQVRSLSKSGLSQVVVVFEDDVNTYFARQLVFERVEIAKSDLPPGIEPELGPISTGLGEIYQYTLESDSKNAMELRTIQDWIISPQLRAISGVNEVNSFGGFVKQYHVVVDPEMLIKYGISLTEFFDSLAANNANAGGNFITKGWEQSYIRSVGMINSIEDIEHIVLHAKNGTPVFVKDVAEVLIGHYTRQGAVTRDGKGETVAGMVIMLKDENSKIVVDRVKEKIPEIQKSLPKNVKINTFYDRTSLIQSCINTIFTALSQGGIFVMLILFVFLWNFRAAIIVALSLPLSVLIAFIFMDVAGVTANLMSLGGLAIAIGIIVDGAIVITENIVRHMAAQENALLSKFDVIKNASNEVARPVIFSILIIIIVFFPLFTLEQMEGKMFKPLALTLCFAMIGSLFVAIVFIPVLCSLILPRFHKESQNPVIHFLQGIYTPFLSVLLKNRSITIVAALILFIVAVILIPYLGMEFLPALDEGAIAINLVRLPTASLDGSKDVVTFLEKKLLKYEEIETIVTKTGRAEISEDPMGPEQNDLFIMLKPYNKWKNGRKKTDLIKDIETELLKVPGIRPSFSQPIALRVNELISGIKSDVAIKIFGTDLELLKDSADTIAGVLSRVDGAADVKIEQISGFEQLEIIIDREQIARHKINVNDINTIVEIAIGGKIATMVVENQMKFGILVRYPEYARKDSESIEKLLIPSPLGYNVPLGSLSTIKEIEAPAQISRENGMRRVVVECNVRGRDLGGFVSEIKSKITDIQEKLPPGYYIVFGGQFENQQRAMNKLMVVVPISIFLIFLMLFSGFQSFKSALLVFANLPFALVGGVLAIHILKLNLSVSAVVGFIALFGMAVENGMVLITFLNQLRQQGFSVHESIITGCSMRLRPLLMTALTTLLGLLPIIYASGAGAEIQRPLATVVLGGLISSLALTLFVLPVLYSMVFKK